MTTLHHSIIGLPRSGKTTFLAALWHLIDAGEVDTKLVLHKLNGNHRYLNRIVEAWRRCEEVPRTSMSDETTVTLHVRAVDSGQQLVLDFPDLSGESLENIFKIRVCSQRYIDSYKKPGGILLFINADRPLDGLSIVDLLPLLGDAADGDKESATETTPWTPDLVPEQVRLVDLLQMLQRPPFERRSRRLAIVISAWDVVQPQQINPEIWLAREMPLLDQYLRTNRSSFDSRVFGISAQGGTLSNDTRSALLAQAPSRRVICTIDQESVHDITLPIYWLNEGF